MKALGNAFFLGFSVLALSSCSDMWFGENEAPPLPGERISVLELQSELEPSDIALDAQGFIVAEAWENRFWPQAGGYPNHAMQHLALDNTNLKRKWSSSIGRGATDRLPLTAQPIIVDGVIYTLDSKSNLKAFEEQSGKRLWDLKLKAAKKNNEAAVSGGLGFGAGYVFATTGQDVIFAVDPKTQAAVWTKDLNSPLRAAPAVLDNRVYALSLDGRLIAMDAQGGEILWEHQGLTQTSTLLGAASPAVNDSIVVAPYSSGELFGLRVENGSTVWSDSLSALHKGAGFSNVSDIKGHPVIDKDMIFAISYSGRMIAIHARTGERIWAKDIGSGETPWVAGNMIFVMTSDNKLVALSRDSGAIAWVTPMRRFRNEDDKIGAVSWSAPIFAGGRILAFNSEGEAVEVDPDNGGKIREWKTGVSVSVPPLVANNTLYLLGDNGTLYAYQ